MDLSVHKPEDRFPDAADPYHRYDPSILHQSLSEVQHAQPHGAALPPGTLLLCSHKPSLHVLSEDALTPSDSYSGIPSQMGAEAVESHCEDSHPIL